MSTAFRLTVEPPWSAPRRLKPWLPTYEMSMAIAHGSARCTPACHCHCAGTFASYWKVDQLRDRQDAEALAERLQLAVAEVGRGRDRRVARDREHGVAVRTVVEETAAGADDRRLVAASRRRPRRSADRARSSARCSRSWRCRRRPGGCRSAGCPMPGIGRADRRLRVGRARQPSGSGRCADPSRSARCPSRSPRRCCSPARRAPAPAPVVHSSGKKFDICWNLSYCGCWRVKRTP